MINELTAKFGAGKLARLLSIAIPSFEKDYAMLCGYLQSENWSKAGQKAHGLKSTALLFSSQSLIICLDAVEEEKLDLISDTGFQSQLDQEYQSCLRLMKQLKAEV
jgi:hypothetical protein